MKIHEWWDDHECVFMMIARLARRELSILWVWGIEWVHVDKAQHLSRTMNQRNIYSKQYKQILLYDVCKNDRVMFLKGQLCTRLDDTNVVSMSALNLHSIEWSFARTATQKKKVVATNLHLSESQKARPKTVPKNHDQVS